MAEFITILQEIKQLPSEAHLLCPRQDDYDQDRYEEEENPTGSQVKVEPDKLARIEQAKVRRKKFISSLQLLAYNGQESEQYQRFIWEKIDEALGKCDLCIRNYYVAKIDFLTDLRQEYEEEDIKTFFGIIDQRDLRRVKRGLTGATRTLENLPEQKRGTGSLDPADLHAIFEALICEAFLRDETLIREYFDTPFRLIQTKKPLRIREILPATTRFLFDANSRRLSWARSIWERIDRRPTELEWSWAIRDFLESKLQQASDANDISRLWSALTVILSKLDEWQITHKLLDLVPNVCITALNHISSRSMALPYIIQAIGLIMEKAPDAFWQAIGSISSQTIAELIFASPLFDKYLKETAASQKASETNVLSWIPKFLGSLKPGNRPAACRILVNQLFARVHSEVISTPAKSSCFDMVVQVILQTLVSFSDNENTRLTVERLVLSDTLDTISHRIEELLRPNIPGLTNDDTRSNVLAVVRHALTLECQCLKSDFAILKQNEVLQHESSSYSPEIWSAVVENLHEDDVRLSVAVLQGIMPLPGLEQFRGKPTSSLSREKQAYNTIFESITGMVGKVLERLSEFKPGHLDRLFESQETSMSVIAALFSADQSTYEAAIDLVKNISGESGRKEALGHLIEAFFEKALYGICWTFRRISIMRTFASVPRMLRSGMEILDVLCNPTGKLMRSTLDDRDYTPLMSYWSYQWNALRTVFRQTEQWSNEVHDKKLMSEVCRDAMQFAEALFEQYDLFASVLTQLKPEKVESIAKQLLDSTDSEAGSPLKTIESMSKWLRLRDEYLADTLVKLITKMLYRLKQHETITNSDGLLYVEEVATKSSIKTILSEPQKAMLARALENYTGKQLERLTKKKQSTLTGWTETSKLERSRTATPVSDNEKVKRLDNITSTYQVTQKPASGLLKDPKTNLLSQTAEKPKDLTIGSQQIKSRTQDMIVQKTAIRHAQDSKAFIENRKREEAARKLRDKEAALRLRGKVGVAELTQGQGSGVAGLGVQGKDHSSGVNSLMVSSESDTDDDSDDDLFGKIPTTKESSEPNGIRKVLPMAPVRKIKQQRSQKDVRARLAPDLSNLHRTILGWDFFVESDLPPNSMKDDYTLVTNVFKSAADYQRTFEPLLILEGWQSFRVAREDGSFKPFEVKVSSALIVDNFFEVNSVLSINEAKELGIGTADIILLSTAKQPEKEPDQPHCFARVKEISRKKGEVHVVYRVNAANPLRPFLNSKSNVYGINVLSLTPLEREYGALMALPYYDLCDEIISAKPSPILNYPDTDLAPYARMYNLNTAQAKAVKSGLDNDAFTLIQGPPGSGKTKTICAMVGAMLTNSSKIRPQGQLPAPKKILVCAPSNAAVDELVMRFKEAVTMMDGSTRKLNVVRLGRSEAINSQVKDVTLEELVTAKLSATAPKGSPDDIHAVMMEHKSTSDELNEIRTKINEARGQGYKVPAEDELLLDGLKRKQKNLGTKIDDIREKQNAASRDAELTRKRVQQEILDSAHVLCATLSGSGHEIFQGLNIEFETVIIDEAAQSIELSALIPLKYGCSKCVLVGDPKQLPPTVLSRQAAKFQYEQSLFARMESNHKSDVHLLDTQYRMHPEISLFPSKTFYDSKLRDGPDMAQLRARPWHHSTVFAPYRFFDVQGMSQAATKGHSLINFAEINVAMQIYHRLITDVRKYDFTGKIGIITPYKGQLREMKYRFIQRYGEGITSAVDFNTTDAFQGRESEIVIFSCVRASTKGIGFLNDVRRMNVGLTRAKCSLWVLGNSGALVQGEFWRALVQDVKSRNLYTDGDILRLLNQPLLTEDMMKMDVEMADAEVTDSASFGPKQQSSTRNYIPQAGNELKGEKLASGRESLLEKGLKPGAADNSANPSRPSSSTSATSSSTSSGSIAINHKTQPTKLTEQRQDLYRQNIQTKPSSVAPEPKTQQKPRLVDVRSTMNGPSGGSNGLDDRAKCGICGSHAHVTFNCDNERAKAASMGNCDRCHIPGHTYASCQAPRCFECGEVGHVSEACKAALNLRLTRPQKEELRIQEIRFGRSKDRARERRADQQLGDHDPHVPKVRSTASSNNDKVNDHKRKREHIEPNPPHQDKTPKYSNGAPISKDTSTSTRNGNLVAPVQVDLTRPDPPPDAPTGPRHIQTPTIPPPVNAPTGPRNTQIPPIPMIRKKKPRGDDVFVKRK